MKKVFSILMLSLLAVGATHSVNPYESWGDMDFRSTYEPIDWSAMRRYSSPGNDYGYRSQSSSYDNATNAKRVSADVEQVWIEHNVFDSNGIKGMWIHVKFTFRCMLNKQGDCILYFHDENGNALKDTNKKYWTSDGNVCTSKFFKPSYENSLYEDFKIFMPYSELHLDRTTSCYFKVVIWNGDEVIARSGKYSFRYTVN